MLPARFCRILFQKGPGALYLDGDLLGPTQRGGVEVEDNIGSLEGNIAEDVDANVSRRLEATVALVAKDRLLNQSVESQYDDAITTTP